MTKAEIRGTVETCMKNRKLCRAFMRYDLNYFYYFPLMLNDKLFLGIEEDSHGSQALRKWPPRSDVKL